MLSGMRGKNLRLKKCFCSSGIQAPRTTHGPMKGKELCVCTRIVCTYDTNNECLYLFQMGSLTLWEIQPQEFRITFFLLLSIDRFIK